MDHAGKARAPREYLVRNPAGVDVARGADFDQCAFTADTLGAGSVVVPLDDFLLPMRTATGEPVISYQAR